MALSPSARPARVPPAVAQAAGTRDCATTANNTVTHDYDPRKDKRMRLDAASQEHQVALERMVVWAREQESPSDTAKAVAWLMSQIHPTSERLAELRTQAVRRMVSDGMSFAEIATDLGLSRARVGQIAGR